MLEFPSLSIVSLGGCGRSRSLSCRASVETYPRPVRRLPVFFIVVSDFVEIVLVQLPDETRKVAVFEVLGQYMFGKLLVLLSG
jgi:hypothetical protein